MIVAYVPILVWLIGLGIILATTEVTHPKLHKAGWILFGCGVLVTLFSFAGHVVAIGK